MIDAVVLGELDVVAVVPDARDSARSTPRGTCGRPDRSRSRPASTGTAWCRPARPSADAPAVRRSSKTSTRMPSSARLNLAAPHRARSGLPPTKQPTMSVPPEIDARCTSRLIVRVHEVEALGDQRRAGRRHRAHRSRGRAWRLARTPGLCDRVDELGGRAEERHPGLVREIEQRARRPDAPASRRRAAASPRRRARSRASSTSSSRRS